MRRMRLDSNEAIATGWAGAPEARNLPDTLHASASAAIAHSHSTNGIAKASGLPRGAFRFMRNAIIGLALVVAVPLVVVGVLGSRVTNHMALQILRGAREKVDDANKWRGLAAEKDPAITPMQAGLAFRALQSQPLTDAFPMRPTNKLERPWRQIALTTDMFSRPNTEAAGPSAGWHGPSSRMIIAAATGTLSPAELGFLRSVAEAPLWREFDMVAHARQVDIIGGSFVTPFQSTAYVQAMPIWRFADTKELAYAGVSRAAYYVAIGQPEKAEATLRSIISFGFALIDNGTHSIDALIGRLIVGIGRDGLNQFNVAVKGESLADDNTRASKFATKAAVGAHNFSASEFEAMLIAEVNNQASSHALRFEALSSLSFASCGSVGGMLLGPSDNVKNTFENARHSLARYPSENAYIDLVDRSNRGMDLDVHRSVGERLVLGAAAAASAITGNERIIECTHVALIYK